MDRSYKAELVVESSVYSCPSTVVSDYQTASFNRRWSPFPKFAPNGSVSVFLRSGFVPLDLQ